MNTMELLPGRAFQGGFFGGKIQVDGQAYAIIVAPKALGEHKDTAWSRKTKPVEGALSYCDGFANTRAMAEAGSDLAKWALAMTIDGYADWYLPSQDELEILYRNLKPTSETNWCYYRSGTNLNSCPPTAPYTPYFPKQTDIEIFREGGDEAFDGTWYWSSTQHVSDGSYVWGQDFDDGNQGNYSKVSELRARAVRRSPI